MIIRYILRKTVGRLWQVLSRVDEVIALCRSRMRNSGVIRLHFLLADNLCCQTVRSFFCCNSLLDCSNRLDVLLLHRLSDQLSTLQCAHCWKLGVVDRLCLGMRDRLNLLMLAKFLLALLFQHIALKKLWVAMLVQTWALMLWKDGVELLSVKLLAIFLVHFALVHRWLI